MIVTVETTCQGCGLLIPAGDRAIRVSYGVLRVTPNYRREIARTEEDDLFHRECAASVAIRARSSEVSA